MNTLSRLLRMLRPGRPRTSTRGVRQTQSGARAQRVQEISAPWPSDLSLRYAARPDARPDAGEVVWAWVPYAEDPAQGKDRPLLVIARAGEDDVYAMKLTSRAPDRGGDHIALGAGPWDRSQRASWVDIDQLYRVPPAAIRREGAAVERAIYTRVAAILAERHGWRAIR